jgi:hypothetical protein
LQLRPDRVTAAGNEQPNVILDLQRLYRSLYGRSSISGSCVLDLASLFAREEIHGHTGRSDAEDLAGFEEVLAERDTQLAFGC